ncbi:hypothetical protein DL98DRAFT_437915, partial [Cadophora sp. DSE1049]
TVYDSACIVYNRNETRSFFKSPNPASYIYVQTFITNSTTFNTFAYYLSKS